MFGSSGLRGGPGGDAGPVNVWSALLVPMQDENHEAQSLSPRHETLGKYNDAACNDSLALSRQTIKHYLKLSLLVVFSLLKLLVMNIGTMTFTSICRTQHRKIEGTLHLRAFTLSSAHLEFLGLMVIA